jgi:hypothetical protein
VLLVAVTGYTDEAYRPRSAEEGFSFHVLKAVLRLLAPTRR